MKLKPRFQQHIYKGLMVGYSRAQQFHVGIRASICVFILPMHICISLYIGRFCGQHGCKLVTAESIIWATSDGGYCRSVHVCVLLKHDEHDIIGNQREWTFSIQERARWYKMSKLPVSWAKQRHMMIWALKELLSQFFQNHLIEAQIHCS